MFFGFIIGAFIGLARLSHHSIIQGASTIYIEVIRGTPILVQIYFLYYGVSDLLSVNLDKIFAAYLAIAVNAGAYIAEIVRGSVDSVDRGQTEAGRSLGLTRQQTMQFIVWPQAIKRMLPPLGNQFVISLKDTSLFSVIAVADVLYMGKQYINTSFNVFETYTMVAVMYLIITIPTSIVMRRIERRMDVS